MDTAHADRMIRAATALRSRLPTVLARVDELAELIAHAPGITLQAPATMAGEMLRLDRATYSVHWLDRSCPLCGTMRKLWDNAAEIERLSQP